MVVVPHAEDLKIPMISLLLAAVLCLTGGIGASSVFAQPPESSSEPAGKVYHEAPELARRVTEGKLPPVASRLPDDPMVVPVYEEIGRYGGTWRRLMRGTSDIHAFTRITYENILRWSSDAKEIIPNLANRWEWIGDDFRCLRVHLRKGLRWSDGAPFTTDDVIFWWEKIAQDKRVTPAIPKFWCPGGKPMELRKIDDRTFEMRFAAAFPMAIEYLAFKAGQWPLGFERYGFFAPKHYLEPALPTVGANIRRPSGMQPSYELFERMAHDFNPDRPVMTAWRVCLFDEGSRLLAERNPYYFKVDPAGNQLPYIDAVQHEFYFNPEMLYFRALTGEVDMQLRGFATDTLPMLRDWSVRKGFRVLKYYNSPVSGISLNVEYKADPLLREYFQNKDFRRALSLAIDRDLIRQILGKDIHGPATYNQLPYARDYMDIPGLGKYLRYDPNAANRMLDALGLTQRDGDGFRAMKDGRTMSIIIEVSGTTVHPSIEIVAACWNAVGLKTTVKPQDRTLNDQRLRGGLFMATPDSHDGVFSVLAEDTRFAMSKWGGWCWAYAMWYRSGGESGVEPPEEVKRFQKIYELMQATDDREVQKKLMAELVIKHDDSVWYMPLMQTAPYVGIARNEFRNVPVEGVGSFITYCPGHFNPEQFFFKR